MDLAAESAEVAAMKTGWPGHVPPATSRAAATATAAESMRDGSSSLSFAFTTRRNRHHGRRVPLLSFVPSPFPASFLGCDMP